MLHILLGICNGFLPPVQTAANTRLRKRTGSPFSSSFISFLVGVLFLLLLLLCTGQLAGFSLTPVFGQPWWLWTGGMLGVVYITGNILLMPRLGSVQTIIFPVLGQVLMGLAIDHFGWFGSTVVRMTWLRALGALLLLAGVLIITLARLGGKTKTPYNPSLLPWQLLGVAMGMMITCQTAINGRLGGLLGSALRAALISFSIGALTLLIGLCFLRPRLPARDPGEHSPWWMWIGGILGASAVYFSAYLSPILGTGYVTILGQLGNMVSSLLIDHFGLMQTPVRKISLPKLAGLVCMLAGSACIRLL